MQCRLYRRRPSAHEWIIDNLAWLAQPVNEEGRELRLEASPIAYFMNTVRLALAGGPELVDVIGNPIDDLYLSCFAKLGIGFQLLYQVLGVIVCKYRC